MDNGPTATATAVNLYVILYLYYIFLPGKHTFNVTANITSVTGFSMVGIEVKLSAVDSGVVVSILIMSSGGF